MGVEGTCRSPNRGGWSLFARSPDNTPALYSHRHSLTPASSGVLSRSIVIDFQPESGKNRAKVNIYLRVFVYPREDRRQGRAKSKYIFEMWVQIVQVSPVLFAYLYCVHLCRCAGSLGLQDLPERWLWSSCRVFCLLSALSLCLWCVVFEYGSILRF